MAYSTVWLSGLLPDMVMAFTVMLFCVVLPLCVGAPLTAAPSPRATALATIVPVGVIALPVAPETFAAEMDAGSVNVVVVVLAAEGVPVMVTVTTVPLVRCAAPAVNPGGRFVTAKLAAVIDEAYVPLVSV